MVKRALVVAVVAAAALIAAVAAPALTLPPYRPDAVDFEIAPSGAGLHSAGGGYVSPVIHAPKRFNLLGMRWKGGAKPKISVRVRKAGGAWSRWAKLDVDPADS